MKYREAKKNPETLPRLVALEARNPTPIRAKRKILLIDWNIHPTLPLTQ